MPIVSSAPQHCPGFQQFKELKSFICKCNHRGATKEIFSHEFNRPHKCPSCKQDIDFGQCKLDARAGSNRPE